MASREHMEEEEVGKGVWMEGIEGEEVDEVSMEVDEWEEWEESEEESVREVYSVPCARLGLHEMPLQAIRASTMSRSKKAPNFESDSVKSEGEGLKSEERERYDDEPFQIVPGLYLGGEVHAKREYMLQRIGVTHVLGIHETASSHFPKSFNYLIIPIRDKQDVNIAEHFKDSHTFIRNALSNQGTVFVHCWAGMSRSATIVISYLMSSLQIPLANAYRQVLQAKPDVNPNNGFIFQLRQFESTLGLTSKPQETQKKTLLQKSGRSASSPARPSSSNPSQKGKGSKKSNQRR